MKEYDHAQKQALLEVGMVRLSNIYNRYVVLRYAMTWSKNSSFGCFLFFLKKQSMFTPPPPSNTFIILQLLSEGLWSWSTRRQWHCSQSHQRRCLGVFVFVYSMALNYYHSIVSWVNNCSNVNFTTQLQLTLLVTHNALRKPPLARTAWWGLWSRVMVALFDGNVVKIIELPTLTHSRFWVLACVIHLHYMYV